MTENKRYVDIGVEWIDGFIQDHEDDNDLFSISTVINKLNEQDVAIKELEKENEQLKEQKPFLKIHNDYFIQYGDDRELFNLHKPSDIRCLCHLINRENGYDELECEYNGDVPK